MRLLLWWLTLFHMGKWCKNGESAAKHYNLCFPQLSSSTFPLTPNRQSTSSSKCVEHALKTIVCGKKKSLNCLHHEQTCVVTALTCLVSPPASEVWSSELCHPSWSPPASPPRTAPLPWAHLSVCGRSESDQLAAPSWSSTFHNIHKSSSQYTR